MKNDLKIKTKYILNWASFRMKKTFIQAKKKEST